MKYTLLLGVLLVAAAGQESATRPDAKSQRAPEGRVFVHGAVKKAGSVVLPDPGYSLLHLVMDSALAEDVDLSEVLVVRQDRTNPLVLDIDVRKMMVTGDTTWNVLLKDGDIVHFRKDRARAARHEQGGDGERARPESRRAR
jgi:hypothetical protein